MRSRFVIVENISLGDDLYVINPPLECEVALDHNGWRIECDLIRVTCAKTASDAMHAFKKLLLIEYEKNHIELQKL